MANDGNDSKIKSVLISVPHHIKFLSRWSTRNHIKQILYPGQIVYSFRLLPKTSINVPKAGISNSSAYFVISRIAKSQKHMV